MIFFDILIAPLLTSILPKGSSRPGCSYCALDRREVLQRRLDSRKNGSTRRKSHAFSLASVILNTFQTHNVAMATPLAHYVVSLGQDGRIACCGTVSDALKKDKTLAKELAEGARAIKDDEKKIDAEEPDEVAKPTDGKLILAEEIAEGHVSWDASGCSVRFVFSGLELVDVTP